MTDDELRIAIAKVCGWSGFEGSGEFLIGVPPQNEITEKALGPKVITNWTARHGVPDYLNSLDAMREAEKVLTPGQLAAYVEWLRNVVEETSTAFLAYAECATARQRAEAFALTLGLKSL